MTFIRNTGKKKPTKWTAHIIASALARQTFQRRNLVIVPNCNWTGHECDLLVVTGNLRIIDVEIKISRSDLKADAKKDKWWHRGIGRYCPETQGYVRDPDTPKEWPRRVWKHYYAMPKEIWVPELEYALPSSASGIVLLSDRHGFIEATVHRRAKPCKDADRLKPEQAIDIARLASLRLWDAYTARDNALQAADHWREQAQTVAAAE